MSPLSPPAGDLVTRKPVSGTPAPPKKGGSDLATRLAVAAVGIPAGFLVVWAGGWVLAAILLLLGVGGAREVMNLARARGIRPFDGVALPAVAAVIVLAPLSEGDMGAWALPTLAVVTASGLLALALAVFLRGPGGNPLAASAVTLLGVVYVGVPLAAGWFLRHHPASSWETAAWAGTGLLLLPMIATWLGDTTAYFGGRAMGKRKLLPSVSPAKTVEGGVSGLAGAVLGSVLVTAFLFPALGGQEPLSLPAAALLGLIIGGVAQVGDLAESALKREAGVKDSGAILPGHGGILDRFDAVLLTLPLTWLLLPLFLGWGG
jgi:phosphatidate cytidylyltransferase